MPTAENAKLEYEAAQSVVGMTELTDQGDATEFKSSANLWSERSGYKPDVKPNGLATGGVITPAASGNDDQFDITALTCYLAGVSTNVNAATDQAIVRPSVDTHQKFSITITSAGALAVVDGAEGTGFSDTRGANGGPPWIDNDAIEIGQIWVDAQASAPLETSEIHQIPGEHVERYDYPTWEEDNIDVENGVLGYAGIRFHAALPKIHSEDAGSNTYPKDVYASWSEPQFAELIDAYDFVPPALSHTVSSKQVYGRTKGSKASSINQGSFSFEMKTGIDDAVLNMVDDELWFRFYQDRLETPYILCQGSLGVTTTFTAGENIVASCTISADVPAERVTS